MMEVIGGVIVGAATVLGLVFIVFVAAVDRNGGPFV